MTTEKIIKAIDVFRFVKGIIFCIMLYIHRSICTESVPAMLEKNEFVA